MKRATIGLLILAGSLAAAPPERADAQVDIRVRLYWESGDGWRTYAPTYERREVRVPRGHLPPPGYCRVWYSGRPPGHQPPPRPCGVLFRHHYGPDVVILRGPVYTVGWHDDRGDDDDRRRGRWRARR